MGLTQADSRGSHAGNLVAVSLKKSHDMVILSFCSILKGQANNQNHICMKKLCFSYICTATLIKKHFRVRLYIIAWPNETIYFEVFWHPVEKYHLSCFYHCACWLWSESDCWLTFKLGKKRSLYKTFNRNDEFFNFLL